jgi:hypothetical protein
MIESITFNTAESTITVTLEDGTETTYTDSATYLADYPEREADVPAMGWKIPEGWVRPEPEPEPEPEPDIEPEQTDET